MTLSNLHCWALGCGFVVMLGLLPSCSSGEEGSGLSGSGAMGSGAAGSSSVVIGAGTQGQGAFGTGASAGLLDGVNGQGASSSTSVTPVLPDAACAGQAYE